MELHTHDAWENNLSSFSKLQYCCCSHCSANLYPICVRSEVLQDQRFSGHRFARPVRCVAGWQVSLVLFNAILPFMCSKTLQIKMNSQYMSSITDIYIRVLFTHYTLSSGSIYLELTLMYICGRHCSIPPIPPAPLSYLFLSEAMDCPSVVVSSSFIVFSSSDCKQAKDTNSQHSVTSNQRICDSQTLWST